MSERPDPGRAEEIRRAVRKMYAEVAERPGENRFPYPVGRPSAVELGYRREWLDSAPAEVVDRFVGVGNPFRIRLPASGERVLDLGCGSGMDVHVASQLVGAPGLAVGLDLSVEMLGWARRSAAGRHPPGVAFLAGTIESLPFLDRSFDLVISNGALNLVADKDAAFREIHRVLRPGGTLAVADLLVTESVPEDLLENMDAWSS